MPLTLKNSIIETDLAFALGEKGEKEYKRLLRVLRMAQGRFTLLPVESDFTSGLRDALLDRLGSDLAEQGFCLRLLRLSRIDWDVFALPELASPIMEREIVVLVGLEDTPGIVSEAGREQERPPALAALNQLREALRKRIPAPLLVWCDSFAYDALLNHAPDFFDHFTGLFHFKNEIYTPAAQSSLFDVSLAFPITRRKNQAVVHASINFYTEALQSHSAPTMQRAQLLTGFAEALAFLQADNQTESLSLAEDVAREALSLLSPDKDTYEWARAQQVLGVIFVNHYNDVKTENLKQAIEFFRQALSIYTESRFPREWAEAQYNLGYAYFAYALAGSRKSDENPGVSHSYWNNAITCFMNALRVYTQKHYPEQWAALQNFLGGVYFRLPSQELPSQKKASLKQAVGYYEAALRVFTEASYPHDWAMTQNFLGIVFYRLGSYDRRYLKKSIACYKAAERVYTKKDDPYSWAVTQQILGLAMFAQGDIESALLLWSAAERMFCSLGREAEAEEARTLQAMWTDKDVESVDNK